MGNTTQHTNDDLPDEEILEALAAESGRALYPDELISEPVTVSGWYKTSHGRWAEVVWDCGTPHVLIVADRPESSEEAAARIAREP